MTTGRKIAVALVAFAIAVATLLVFVVVHVLGSVHDGERVQFDALLADLAARGEPVFPGDLAGPAVEPGDDGAPLIREAWAWLDEHAPPADERPTTWELDTDAWEALSEEERARHAGFVRSLQPYLDLVRAGTERPVLRLFDRPEDFGFDERTAKTVGGVQWTMRLLDASARVAQDPDARLRDLRARGLLGARLERHGSALTALIAVVTQMAALGRLREYLEHDLVDAASAVEMLAPVLRSDVRSQVRVGIRAERTLAIGLVRTAVGDAPATSAYSGPTVDGWMAALSRDSVGDFALEVQVILDEDTGAWSDLGRRLVRLPERTQPRPHTRPWSMNPGRAVAGASAILLPKLAATGARTTALQRLALLSLTAVRAHEVDGIWPGSLDEIDVPAATRIDPFTDRPFVFERLPDGVRISSPGPVDVDVWRSEAVERNLPSEDGLVWTLRR